MDWYLLPWKKYADFNGRARRKEYWTFRLVNLGISLVLMVAGFISLGFIVSRIGVDILSLAFSLAVLIPEIAVTVRRLHDTGRSGWWYLISLVPIAGFIIILIFTIEDGSPGSNQYGPNPKYEPAPTGSSSSNGGFCRNCGTQLPPGALYCQKCGAKQNP